MNGYRVGYVYVRNKFAGIIKETDEGSAKYVLSPAYDLLPVNIILSDDKDQFALSMNGKKRNILKSDFLEFANYCGISRGTAEKIIKHIIKFTPKLIEMCDSSYLSDNLKMRLKNLIMERVEILN